MQRIIAWSRWVDPLGTNQHEFEYVPEKEVKEFDIDSNEEDDTEEDDEPSPVIITPIGILPLKPFNDPSKVFNFWMGETNFSLGKRTIATINSCPGVEFLDIFSRYKFRISVANTFKFQDVRQKIETSLKASPSQIKIKENMVLSKETMSKIQDLIKVQLNNFPYWAIYVCPNNKIDITYAKEFTKEFEEKVNIYESAKNLVGGAFFKYDQQLW